MNSSKEDPQSPSLSKEVDLELGLGNGGMPLDQSDDQKQQNEIVQQSQAKAVKQPSKMMAQSQMNKMDVQEANDCEEISETMHATQFGENNIDVVTKQRVWFTKKKIIACIILIILEYIGFSGGTIWYFYPREAKNDKDEPMTGAQSPKQALKKGKVDSPNLSQNQCVGESIGSITPIQEEHEHVSDQDETGLPTTRTECDDVESPKTHPSPPRAQSSAEIPGTQDEFPSLPPPPAAGLPGSDDDDGGDDDDDSPYQLETHGTFWSKFPHNPRAFQFKFKIPVACTDLKTEMKKQLMEYAGSHGFDAEPMEHSSIQFDFTFEGIIHKGVKNMTKNVINNVQLVRTTSKCKGTVADFRWMLKLQESGNQDKWVVNVTVPKGFKLCYCTE